MIRCKRDKKKIKEEQINLCTGTVLLNHPEMTDCGHGGTSHPYLQRKKNADSRGIWAKCLLEVLLVGGSMCGFLSCIEMSYGVPVILGLYLVLAVYFSSLFKSGKVWRRDIGYVIFLVVFILFIMTFRRYVNSGFYAIINEFLDHITDYYGAQEVKVFSEAIGNRSLTVPIAAIAIGCIEIIVLNIFINTNMSVGWAVWFALPVFILTLFFRFEPHSIYLFMISSGLLGVICLKGNGHFRITDNDNTFEYDSRRHKLVYRHSDRASLQLVACVIIACIVVGSMIMILKPIESYRYRYKDSTAKSRIEAPLGNLLMYGFEALRNTANTGGLANGRLGGVSDVNLDGETDLTVRFAPYSADRIYLKAFTGDEYSWDHWDRDRDGLYNSPSDTENEPVMAKGRMDIQNQDGAGNLVYYPYYTEYDDMLGLVLGGLDEDEAKILKDREYDYTKYYLNYSVTYCPYIYDQTSLDKVDDRYLQIPDVNIPVLERFCQNAGIEDDDTEDVEIQKIYNYFVENYPYTLHPGATPRREDYVNYFLETTKKGLCANYATAGTLLLRYLGIPARYIEGYVIDYNDVMDGTILTDEGYKYSDYFEGSADLGETAVVEVSVTDGGAHAWIEAFLDGRWQVVELTPPSSGDEDADQNDFWSRFSKWLTGDSDSSGDTDDNGTETGASMLANSKVVLYVMAAIAVSVMLLWVLGIFVRKLVRFMTYHRRDRTENILGYYRYMCDYMRLADPDFENAWSHIQQIEHMWPDLDETSKQRLADYMEAVSYGDQIPGDEYKDVMKLLKNMLKCYRHTLPMLLRLHIFRKM